MVRAFKAQECAAVRRNRGELGDRVFRIFNHGAGESLGQRAVFDDGVEGDPGDRDVDGIRRVCGFLYGREAAVESSRGVHLHFGGSGVYVFAEGVIWSKN